MSSAKPVNYVQVEVVMPHVRKYNRQPIMRLIYAAAFPVHVGQSVLCPPTRLHRKWTKGTIIALGRGKYTGPVKHLAQLGARKKRS